MFKKEKRLSSFFNIIMAFKKIFEHKAHLREQYDTCDFLSPCSLWLRKIIKILSLTLLFAIGPAHAQNGCCQLSASNCAGPVAQIYCEQELKGMFQEGVECRADTGKCGVLADDDIPNSLLIAMGLVFLCLLGFVVAVVFFARRARKSMETKY